MPKSKIKINFENEKDGKLRFYEKFSESGELLEYAFITPGNDDIQYYTQDQDIKTFPKSQLNSFIIGLYNNISDEKTKHNRVDKKNKTSVVYFSLRMFASNFPLVLLLFIHKGILGTLRYYGLKYSKSKTKDRTAFLSVRIKQGNEPGFLNIFTNSLFDEYLVNGIRKEATRLFPSGEHMISDKDLDNPKTMEKYFSKYYSLNKYLNLKNSKTNFIDITTKKVLASKGDPSDFMEVFGKFMPDKLINGKIEDISDLSNLRIRMSESITHLAYKVLQQGIGYMKNNKGQYNIKLDIDPNFISKELQASGMLQYSQNINPLAELTLSNKITKTGVGNPKQEQINMQRRDLNKSYFGTISPSTTNEYSGIGLNQTLSNKAIIKDRFGNILVRPFDNDINGLDLLSATDSLSPFFEYDDTTRRIMGNQQVSQFTQIESPDEPLVQTGMEAIVPHLVSDRFAIKAKEDGKVIRLDHEMELKYKSGSKDYFNLDDVMSRTSRGVYLPLKLTPLVKNGEKVRKGQVLATTSSLKTGKLAVGKNLVIALMSYRGMNYEDGWAVSESIGKKFKNTLLKRILIPIDRESNILEYKIKVGQETKPGDVLIEYSSTKGNESVEALVQSATESMDGEATDGFDVSIGRNFHQGNIRYNSPGGKIKTVNILINSQSIDSKLLSEWKLLNKELQKKIKNCKELLDPVKQMNCQDQINNLKSTVVGGHKLNNDVFDGTIIEMYIEYPNPIQNGSKFTLLGSSGGKGTVQYMIPEGKEPIAEKTGLKIEFLPTPISNISRKNISVVLSMYTGKISYFLNKKLKELIESSRLKEAEKLLLETLYFLDKTKDKELIGYVKDYFQNSPKEIITMVKQSDPLQKPAFPILVTPFKNKLLMEDIKKAAAFLKIPLNEKVIIREEDGTVSEREVPVGIAPIALLEHIPQFMANVRGSVNIKKSAVTGQGRSGTKEGNGAVRIGLYDMFGLSYRKSTALLKEMHFMKSDNAVATNKLNNSILKTGKVPSQDDLELDEETEKLSKTKKLIETYFYGAMLKPNL